jgi:predicted nucleic acid-binding protein
VNAEPPFGGGVYIADSSAWFRADRLPEPIKTDWERALENNQIAACAPITLEILYSAQNAAEFDWWADHLWALSRVADINRDAYWAAVEGYREIAHEGPHRDVPFPDLLVAGAATAHHFGVLHYDGHYDRLAALESFEFESRWIAPPGTIP